MATIYDVAKESGFSLSTVSNVLNNGPKPVRAETKRRILEVVSRLGYHPNAAARGLARQKSNTIGILFGVVDSVEIVINAYSAAILQAVLEKAVEQDLDVIHLTRPWCGASQSLARFRDGRADGLIVVAPRTDSDMVPSLAQLDIPMVVISWPQELQPLVAVDIDDVHGAGQVMRHLLDLGHTKIAHITGQMSLLSAQVRKSVYERVMFEEGITVPNGYLIESAYSVEAGFAAAERILALPNRPEAIFAGNDEIALGVYQCAEQHGIKIPHELSVIGVDDRPFASVLNPGLTTLHQPFDEVGRMAADLLVRQMRGESIEFGSHLPTPALVVRASTAAPYALGHV